MLPEEPADGLAGESEPTPIRRFARTAAGSVVSAALFGLRDALEGPPDEEVAVVVDHAGDPVGDDPIVLRLDPEHPGDSIVWVRRRPQPGPR